MGQQMHHPGTTRGSAERPQQWVSMSGTVVAVLVGAAAVSAPTRSVSAPGRAADTSDYRIRRHGSILPHSASGIKLVKFNRTAVSVQPFELDSCDLRIEEAFRLPGTHSYCKYFRSLETHLKKMIGLCRLCVDHFFHVSARSKHISIS